METKTCTRCGETKPLEEFYRTHKDCDCCRRSACRTCTKAARAAWGTANQSKRTQWQWDWNRTEQRRTYMREYMREYRARKHGEATA